MAERAKIVLYHPQSARRSEPPHSRYADELPLSLLTVAAWPLADGYRVELIDGTRFPREEAHRRAVQACEGALLYATTGIVGPQVGDGLECTRAVKARHPALQAFIGGWFAASVPELQLATGLYEAVVLGQGEITFRELVTAVDSGARLEDVAGLALLREGQLVRTAPRPVVGWEDLLDPPWRLPQAARALPLPLGRPVPAQRRHDVGLPLRLRRARQGRALYPRARCSSSGTARPCAACAAPT